jgi:hypothetical protein
MTTTNFGITDITIPNDLTSTYIGFNKTDFLYYQYQNETMSDCSNSVYDTTCATNIFSNTSGYETTSQKYIDCYNGELCRNKQYADQINSITTSQTDSTKRVLDAESKFNMEVIKTVNYTMGIGLIVFTIFFC